MNLLPPLAVALPLAGAGGVLLFRNRPGLREAASLITGVALAVHVLLLWRAPSHGLRADLWTWLPGFEIAFELEPLGLLFATVAGVLWPVTTLYAIGYMRGNKEKNQTRFFFYFAIAIAAAQWIAMSANMVTLFVGYEVLTLSTWPLVAHKGDEEARRGGRTYLAVLLTTSIGFLIPAMVWTGWLAGGTEFTAGGLLSGRAAPGILAILFALYLFGIGKAALMPFHRWLPSAMVAPTPVSALLHAVAVVKAGVFTVLKVAVYIFGIDTLADTGASMPMMWVAAFTLLAASLVAVTRDNLKSRLAYSTVSQLAYIVLAATLAGRVAAEGGALHIVTHAAGKITLFFCAGAIYTAARKTRISELDGLGRAMPWTFGAFFVASLSIVGLPPLGGVWSKWLLLQGAAGTGQLIMMTVLLVSSLLSMAYLMPIPVRAFFRVPVRDQLPSRDRVSAGAPAVRPEAPAVRDGAEVARAAWGHGEAHWTLVLPIALTALACVGLFFAAEQVLAPFAEVLP